MGVPVAVVPGVLVVIAHLARRQPLEKGRQVLEQSGLVLDGREAGGRARNEDQRLSLAEAVALDDSLDLVGQVEDVVVALRLDSDPIRHPHAGHSTAARRIDGLCDL